MKKNQRNDAFRNVLLLATLVVFALSSCSTKMAFQTSSVVPSAEGSVKVKKNENNNYNIDLNIIRLANSQRLNPPKKMYIVWMETSKEGLKKLGQLKTSSNLFSSTLKSSLKTAVPYKPTGFFITAEDDANVHEPKGQEVLRTK